MNTITEQRSGTERREYSFSTLANCTVAPRRMQGRRRDDRNYAILDRFDAGVVTMTISLVILSIMDSLFTLTILSRGGTEVNPFMNMILQHSVWAFSSVKMLLTAVPAVLLAATGNLLMYGRIRGRTLLAVFVGAYLGLIVYEIMILTVSA